ncbi:MAG: lipoate--protein ligase family protein [Proteobacteria bacterium]|nr:lipoate--protein ligase family protein [Pseudomonadota bacterium]
MVEKTFRVIDTGLREGRYQIAFDQALIDLHRDGKIPDTIRFLRFKPSALVGRHQLLQREVKVDHCRTHGVGLVRRITGGGAIYLDPDQLGWEVVLSRERYALPSLQDYTRRICEAVARGLSDKFAIDARFRPRNDIEVEGQKICGTGGFFDGSTLFFQGTVLIDADPEKVMACLNVPVSKLQKRNLRDASQRITSLKDLMGGVPPALPDVQTAILDGLGEEFGLQFDVEAPSEREEALAHRLWREEIGTDEFVFSLDNAADRSDCSATLSTPGGILTAIVRLEGNPAVRRISDVLLTGDFFVTPSRIVLDLEASLRGIPAVSVGEAVDRFFASAKPEMLSISSAEFKTALNAALRAADS